jgi:hypothetical protein
MHSDHKPGGQNPGTPKPRARKTRGFQPLRWRRNHRRFLEHNVVRAFRLPAGIPSRNGCLPSFASRGRMTAVVLGDGRRRAVDRSQLGPMNHPMHRRPRRHPRKWKNHRRGPGDPDRSSEKPVAPRPWAMSADRDAGMCIRFRVVDGFDHLASVSPLSTVTLRLSADRRPQTLRHCLRNPERCSARSMSLDGRPSCIQITNPGARTRGSKNPGLEKPGASSPWDRVETTDGSSNTTSSGRSGCLSAFHPGTDACQVSPRAVG